MSDLYNGIYGDNNAAHKVCRVAYTLNNIQPVICTYIGDQPFFYMDYADDIEDEDCDLFDESELGLLAEEIRILKSELEGFDSSPLFFSEDGAQRVEEFCENAESLLTDFSMTQNQKEERLATIREILEKSRVASAYLNVAEKHNIHIMMSQQVEFAFYDRRNGSILINPDMELVDQVLLLSRELRRHWQHRQGVLINPLMFQPENAVLVNRAQEADLAVSVIRMAWELQLAGIRDVWERVENSPMADLARAYAREAFLDFRTINNGVASAAVFECWFLSERCRQQDKKIIQNMLADYKGYVFESLKSSQSVTAELISGLGSMPFGKNYLSAHANTIMTDPIFTEVRDRSNANFLWFIKFERSFKETEQQLQSESDLSTHDIRHDLLENKGQNYGTADVIELFEYRELSQQGEKPLSRDRANKPESNGSAEIIDLRRWSGK